MLLIFLLGPPLTLTPEGRLLTGLGPPLRLTAGGSLGPPDTLTPRPDSLSCTLGALTETPSLLSASMSDWPAVSSLVLLTWIPSPASRDMSGPPEREI